MMDKRNQMGSTERQDAADAKPRQQQRAADVRPAGQQSGGESASQQMGAVQFRDWASI